MTGNLYSCYLVKATSLPGFLVIGAVYLPDMATQDLYSSGNERAIALPGAIMGRQGLQITPPSIQISRETDSDPGSDLDTVDSFRGFRESHLGGGGSTLGTLTRQGTATSFVSTVNTLNIAAVDLHAMVHPLTRTFRHSDQEKKYLAWDNRQSVKQLRYAYVGSCLIFGLMAVTFVVMNSIPYPGNLQVMLQLFLGFCLPAIVAVLFTRSSKFIRWAEPVSVILSLLCGSMMIASTSVNGKTTDLITVPSFLLIISILAPFLKIRYFISLIVSAILIAIFVIPTVAAGLYTSLNQFYLSIVILGGFAIIYSFSAYQAELGKRIAFLVDQNMQMENLRLRRRLQRLKRRQTPTRKVDFDSPIMKVLNVLHQIRDKRELDDDDIDSLDLVTRILSNSNVWAPNFSRQLRDGSLEVDAETKKWLFYEVASREKRSEGIQEPGAAVVLEAPAGSQALVGSPSRHVDAGSILPVLTTVEEEQLHVLLADITDWNKFDMFEINRLTHGRPLYFTALYLFRHHDLFSKFNINIEHFKNFAAKVEEGYRDNPYHNRVHAADVLQSVNYILTEGGMAQYLIDHEVLGALLAAMVHDYDHPGHNNNFEIATETDLAITYNDRSVLENHHSASCFRVAKHIESNVFQSFDRDQKKLVRQVIVESIIATDMSLHFEIIGQWKSRMGGQEEVTFGDLNDRLLLLRMLIKLADIGHASKPLFLHSQWTERITKEMFHQGDMERERGLPVSPFMDGTKPNVAKSQIGFIDFVVMPLFTPISEFLDHDVLVDTIILNRDEWDRQYVYHGVTLTNGRVAAQTEEEKPG